MINFRQIKAREQKNKQRILKICHYANENSGIYILTREEGGFKYAYIGQARHILTRLAQHLNGYQYIDISLKKHGLFSEENKTGWKVNILECEEIKLNDLEQKYILAYSNMGYQLRNKTAGGQSSGKVGIAENKASKGYHDGLKQGYLNARKEVAKLFEKNLYFATTKENKNTIKAFEKFNEFINVKENKND